MTPTCTNCGSETKEFGQMVGRFETRSKAGLRCSRCRDEFVFTARGSRGKNTHSLAQKIQWAFDVFENHEDVGGHELKYAMEALTITEEYANTNFKNWRKEIAKVDKPIPPELRKKVMMLLSIQSMLK